MWVGDPKPILKTIYKYYFSRVYLGSRNTIKGLKYYQNVYSIIQERLADLNDGIILTKQELYNGVISEEVIPKGVQKEIVESINSMHLFNELRMNKDIVDFVPVVSKVIIIKDGRIKNSYYGENKLKAEHKELQEFKEVYFGKEPKTVHAEVDVVFKVYRKFKNNNSGDCSDCKLIIITVRNGHNILSRPCKFCRNMLRKVLKELSFKEVYLVYPIIDDLVLIEKINFYVDE